MSGWFLLLICLKEIPILNANSVDSDQRPCSVVSETYGSALFAKYPFGGFLTKMG